jgi:hypothetical protein
MKLLLQRGEVKIKTEAQDEGGSHLEFVLAEKGGQWGTTSRLREKARVTRPKQVLSDPKLIPNLSSHGRPRHFYIGLLGIVVTLNAGERHLLILKNTDMVCERH